MGHNDLVEMLSADLALDEALADAVEFAREAVAADVGADRVGEHLEVAMEGERLATHLYECTSLGYRGWRWAVTIARAPDATEPTVCDVVLLPGPDALVAPAWVPWSERVRPGDLGVGDVFPTGAEDPRLVAGFTDEDDLEGLGSKSPLAPGAWELGLGRMRVLSQIGRDDAADRWQAGDTGPESAMAQQAPLACSSCGFHVPMGGVFGQMFAVCANVMAPADGRVVALDYGCGAHSEVQVEEVLVDEAFLDETLLDEVLADETLLDEVLAHEDFSSEALDLEGADAADSPAADSPAATNLDEPDLVAKGDDVGEPAVESAPKRPRGRGWLRGRSS